VGPHPHDLYLATFGRSTMFAAIISVNRLPYATHAPYNPHEPYDPHDPPDPHDPYQLYRMTICPLRGGPYTVPVLIRP
jgi:hypothetical protein